MAKLNLLWNPLGVAYSNDLISVGIFDSIVGSEIFFDSCVTVGNKKIQIQKRA